jgi:hypothetical protein
MGTKKEFIIDKLVTIESALLRFTVKDKEETIVVHVLKLSYPPAVYFSVDENDHPGWLNDQPASLSQLTEYGYLYVSGNISTLDQTPGNILSLKVQHAYWFPRRSKGCNRWFEEVYLC